MNRHSLLLSLLFFGLVIQFGWSQPNNANVGDVVMPTPNAAALGKYTDVPVSYFTGVPSTSIPMHTISDGKVSLPISLNYHSSGIKVAEMASWVGTGWSLRAGGMITRTILDKPDDYPSGYYREGHLIENGTNELEVLEGLRDGEPDIFNFSLPNGISGKYYYTGDGAGVVEFIPKQDLKVEEHLTNGLFTGFTIIGSDGTKYIFGTDDIDNRVALERTINHGDAERISSWYLLRIQSFDGVDNITLDYQAEQYNYKNPSSCKIYYTGCQGNGAYDDYASWGAGEDCVGASYDANHYYTLTQVTLGMRLATITSPTTVVSFLADTVREDLDGAAHRLDAISIISGTKFCSRYQFNYDYFKDTNFPVNQRSESKRLRLLSMQQVSCTGENIEIPPHTFEYEGVLNGDGSPFLPQRIDKGVDHWGFYNGKNQNNNVTSNIPKDTRLTLPNGRVLIEGEALREPDLDFTKYGVLKKINYPTGGSVAFDYELNDYYGLLQSEEEELVSEIRSCPNPLESQCCGSHSNITLNTFTFTSQGELNRAYFSAVLTKIVDDAGDGPIDCNSPLPKLIVRALNVSDPLNPVQEGYYSFNLSSGQMFEVRDDEPLNNLGALSLNTPYHFEVESNNGQARFALFTIKDEFYDTRPAGGLRIQKITTKDGLGIHPDLVKTYEYNSESLPNESSGILFQIPKYAYLVQGVEYGSTEITQQVEAGYFVSQSIVPLGGFDGISIGYKSVKEILGTSESDNGYNIYSFFGSFDPVYNFVDIYPRPPMQYDIYKGKQDKTSTFKVENNISTKIGESDVVPRAYVTTSSPNLIIIKSAPLPCAAKYWVFYGNYTNISSNQFQTAAVTSFRDGVTSLTTYEYDGLNRHLAPISISSTNSDNLVYTTKNKFPFDFTDAVYDSMVARNQIASPVETITQVNDGGTITQTNGKRINCDFFNVFGAKGGSGLDPIYPSLIEGYEMTWDANGIKQITGPNNGWDTLMAIGAYNMAVGKPANATFKGWETEFYDWNALNKKIAVRTYKDFQWVTNYFSGTSIPKESIDIDLQDTDYNFDPLMRLIQINERDGKVITDIQYAYNEGITTPNYIHQKITFEPDGLNISALNELETRQYIDGLGRLLQTVQIKHSPDGAAPKDVITAIEYDNQSRISKAYEPFASSQNDGSFQAIPSGIDFTVKEYEASPFNRVLNITPPDWYPTHSLYGKNETPISVPGTSITYGIGELNTLTIIEPDGSGTQTGDRTVRYTDKRGKTVLNRQQNQSGSSQSNTYSLYDKKERPTTIIPPAATFSDNGLIYTYRYSGENNLLEKKVPDAAKIETLYDPRNLPIAFRDGNLRNDGKWMVTEYDGYGRPTVTGLNSSPTVVDEVWAKTFWDGQVDMGSNFIGFVPLQAPKDLPSDLQQLLDVENANLTPTDNSTNPIYRGKPHYTETAVLSGNTATTNRLFSINRYDAFGRADRVQTDNHLGGFDNTFLYYDLADSPTQSLRFHRYEITDNNIVLRNRDYYDHQGRKIKNNHLISGVGNFSSEVSNLTYNIKDLIESKQLGGTSGGGYLQEINYDYLPNRFLQGINSTMAATDLFSLHIQYDQANSVLNAAAQYDGNIASLGWQVKGSTAQTYGYQYDYLNRLSAANHDSPMNDYATTYDYDARGNMASITRRGMYDDGNSFQSQQIDNMVFMPHTGTNKVKTITDAAPCPDNKVIHQTLDNTEMHAVGLTILADNPVNENANITYQAGTSVTLKPGFHAKAGTDFIAKIATCPQGGYETGGFVQRSTIDYLYDSNGNQTSDPNKGIITDYNYLNLPYQVSFNNGNVIEWLYLANGTKVQKTVKRDGISIPILKQDYISSNEYQNDTLDAIYIADGRLTFDKGVFETYQFYLSDHLGNNRVTFKDNGSGVAEIVQNQDFYPFGLEMEGTGIENTGREDKYKFNGNELQSDFGLNTYDFINRMYDPAVGRFWQIDKLAEDPMQIDKSPYAFSWNNPIRFNDQNGMCPDCDDDYSFVSDVKQNGFFNAVGNYFNPGSLSTGTETEKAQTVTRLHQFAADTEVVKGELKEAAFESAEKTAQFVRSKADETQIGAMTATGVSGGATSPVTMPIAAGAEIISNTALAIEVTIDVARDGTLNQTVDELLFKAIGITSKNVIRDGVDMLNISGHKSEQTIGAVKAISGATNKVAIKAGKTKFDE